MVVEDVGVLAQSAEKSVYRCLREPGVAYGHHHGL